METKGSELSRRSFLATGVAGVAAGSILGSIGHTDPLFSQEKPVAVSDGKPIIRTLGRTGIKMPVVSMGVMNASLPELVKRSYELGIRHFDTAAYYQRGRNEEMVGAVLKQLNARDKVVIGTKVFAPPDQRDVPVAQTRDLYLKTAEESLKRLQTDYVDILYLHNTMKLSDLKNAGVRVALETLKKQGKARSIGFSTHMNMTELISAAASDPLWDVILTSFNYSLADDEAFMNAVRAAAAKGIGLVAMKTQMSQDWYRQNLPEWMQKLFLGPKIHTAALKWALQHSFITTAVPGYTTFEQMEEDWSVVDNLEFTSEEKKFITDKNVKLALGACRQCSRCVAQCPQQVDVPTLMRVHMYTTCYRNFEHARQTLDDIPRGRALAACSTCSSCRVQCQHGVDVAGRLSDLATIYS